MDIDLLSKMVKELILDNDRVVLPGLGCFVAEIVPSVFSDKGYTINPPYRKLSFRAKPDSGEELAKFYSETNNVGYDVADHILTDFVADMKSVLYQKKTVVFPGLGRLRATKENNVFFVADENLEIYPDGFGLEPVSLKTHQQTREEVSAAIEGLRSMMLDEPTGIIQNTERTPQQDQLQTEPHNPLQEQPELQPELQQEQPELLARQQEQQNQLQRPQEPQQVRQQDDKSDINLDTVQDDTAGQPDTQSSREDDRTAVNEDKSMQQGNSLQSSETESGNKKKVWKIILWTIAAAAVLLILALAPYMALAIYAPDFLDSLLYTQEELDILNGRL